MSDKREPAADNPVQNELARRQDAAVSLLPDSIRAYIDQHLLTADVDLECPRGHTIGQARLISILHSGFHIGPEVDDYESVTVQFDYSRSGTVAPAVPSPYLPREPEFDDRVRVTCPTHRCKYSATWTQAKLILLVADALVEGRPAVRLPS